MRRLALATFVALAAFASASFGPRSVQDPPKTAPPVGSTSGVKPRADGMVWLSDCPGANFDEKFAAAVAASDALTPDILNIKIDWTGKSWVMTKSVDLRPLHGNQLRVKMIGEDVWRLIEWRGPSGTSASRVPAFRFYGLKESTVERVKMTVWSNYVVGFDLATDLTINSEGGNHFFRCRVQPWDGTVGSIGFRCGYSTDRTGHNDHSFNVFEQCGMEFYPSGSDGQNGAAGVIEKVCQAGHRGFVFSGYNTLFNVVRDSTVVNGFGVTTKSVEGQDPGGSSTVCDNFGTSGAPIVYDLNIGFNFTARGGRHELGGVLLVQGFPAQGNGNVSHVTLSDMTCDDFNPYKVAKWLNTVPGAMVSAHDCTNLVMSNVNLWTVGELGEPLKEDWLSLWATETPGKPIANLTNVTVGNGGGLSYKLVGFKPKVRGGTWKKVIDGSVSTTSVAIKAD